MDQGISCGSARKMNSFDRGSVENFSDIPEVDSTSSDKSSGSTIKLHAKGGATVPLQDITRTPVHEKKKKSHAHSYAFRKEAAASTDPLCENGPLGSANIHSGKALLPGVPQHDSGLKVTDGRSLQLNPINSFLKYSGLGNATVRCAWSGIHHTQYDNNSKRFVSGNTVTSSPKSLGERSPWTKYPLPRFTKSTMDLESVASPTGSVVPNMLTPTESIERLSSGLPLVRQKDLFDDAEKVLMENRACTEKLIDIIREVSEAKQVMLAELAKGAEEIDETKELLTDAEMEYPKRDSTFLPELQENRLEKSASLHDIYDTEKQSEFDGLSTVSLQSPGVSSKVLIQVPVMCTLCDEFDDVCTQKRLGKEASSGNNSQLPAILPCKKLETDDVSSPLRRSLIVHTSDVSSYLSSTAIVPVCSSGMKKRRKAKDKNPPSIAEEQLSNSDPTFMELSQSEI